MSHVNTLVILFLALIFSMLLWQCPESSDDELLPETIETVTPAPQLPDQDHTWIKVEMRFGETSEVILPERVECSLRGFDPINPPALSEPYPVISWPRGVGTDECHEETTIHVNDKKIVLSHPDQVIGLPKYESEILVEVSSKKRLRDGRHFYLPLDKTMQVKSKHDAPQVSTEISTSSHPILVSQTAPLVFTFDYYLSR